MPLMNAHNVCFHGEIRKKKGALCTAVAKKFTFHVGILT